MSTWAARLSNGGSKSPDSRAVSNTSTPFMAAVPGPSPLPQDDDFSLGVSAEQQRVQKERELREEFRQIAELQNTHAALLQLPLDVWEWVTCFVGYRDVFALASTCRAMWQPMLRRDSVWEQQLRFFHDDVMDMRGGALLMTAFAIPPEQQLSGYEKLKRERRLYVADANREWHFKDISNLEDAETGMFTAPLHLGREATSSSAAAPLSRPTPSPVTTPLSALPPSSSGGGGGGSSGLAGRESTSPPPRMPAVGAASVGVVGSLPLRIWRPVRQTISEDERDRLMLSAAIPRTSDEEEAALLYALALSEAEANGLSPPPPLIFAPPSANRTPPFGPTHSSSSSPEAYGLSRNMRQQQEPQYLKPSEIMTIVDLIQHGAAAQSRIPVEDVTAQEEEMFRLALQETLKGAKRRRLYLGNHHRAVLNNGSTTRNRRGGGAGGSRTEESSAAASSSSPPPPPPINRMMRSFTGELLEIEKSEAHQICEQLLRKPQVLDDFVRFHSYEHNRLLQPRSTAKDPATAAVPEGNYKTRFFMAPEMCRHGRIGLVVVDVVRVLVLVDEERTATDDHLWALDETRGRRLPGQGYNAQYYDPARRYTLNR